MIDINDFKELKEKIEDKQGIKLKDFKNGQSENVFHTMQADEKDGIHFWFAIEKDTLRIIQFYLVHEKRETGIEVLEWLQEYCRKNCLKKIKVANVKDDKIGMHKLCSKFKMKKVNVCENNNGWYCDYIKELT